MKRSRLVALGLAAVMVPGLAGCWSGNDAATTVQSASGDGTQVDANDITIDSATIVAGDPDSGKAAFLATVYNPTKVPDEVVAITADGVAAKLAPEPLAVPALQAVSIQTGKPATADFVAFEGQPGTYVDVVMTFKTAAEQRFTALVVPPSGFYAEAAPEGTTPIPVKVNLDTGHSESTPGGEGAAEVESAPVPAESGSPAPSASPSRTP